MTTTASPIDRIIEALEAEGSTVRESGRDRWQAHCPAHADRTPSLSIARGDDAKPLIKCFAGCENDDVIAALGLTWPELLRDDDDWRRPARSNGHRPAERSAVSRPDFTAEAQKCARRLAGDDSAQTRLWELRRWTPEKINALGVGFDGERITFPLSDRSGAVVGLVRYQPSEQRRNGGPKSKADPGSLRELFPAPESLPADATLFLAEGEPDAVAAQSMGLAAVGVGGVNGWRAEYAERFKGRKVIVCMDCDSEGRKAAKQVADDLTATASEVRVLELDPDREDGYDVTDFARDAESPDDLVQAGQLLRKMADKVKPTRPDLPDGLRATSFDKIAPERVEWLWPDRIPLAGLTLLIGDPGLGKSTLTCDLAAKVSRGEFGPAGDVLMVTAEDASAPVVRPRLEAAKAELSRVHAVRAKRDGLEDGIALPDDVPALCALIEEHGVRLLVIDPLMAHLPESVNSWRDQSVRRALAPLHRLAEDYGCAVLVVGHLNKASGEKALYRAGGSIGIPGAARSALLMASDPDDPDGEEGSRRVLAQVKSNYGQRAQSLAYEVCGVVLPGGIGTSRMVERGESAHGSDALLSAPIGDERTERDEAIDYLRVELADGPKPAKALFRDAPCSDRTLKRAKKSLGIEVRREGFSQGGSWVWELPPESPGPIGGHVKGGHAYMSDVAPFGETRSTGGISPPPDTIGGHASDMAPYGTEDASDLPTVDDELKAREKEASEQPKPGASKSLQPRSPEFLAAVAAAEAHGNLPPGGSQ